ncbi:hypothetical protein LUZ63_009014 [Rhynchospora breviuscula]|uniref:Reverse transcriptase domain-containing protein n=1 Tax=Rhynchospora breviuscula TaxID=2022672 RepID=A0A9Q0CEA6_9POAL|nr:hypothetical protein LUZ63_009014 [Rhynchospora breviuscula]
MSQPKPFKFERFWLLNQHCALITKETWEGYNTGTNVLENFNTKSLQLHRELRSWHRTNLSYPNVLLHNAKTLLGVFDIVEELRVLTPLEFSVRLALRERAFFLANFLEIRWHQRARTRWIQCGDLNTRYFHSVATSKMRNKAITNLTVDGIEISGTDLILEKFTAFFKNLLGTEVPTVSFNPNSLYPDHFLPLHVLDSPFSEMEIKRAVMGLASNKSSGPDGYPNEFFKVNWDLVKTDIISIFEELHKGSLHLGSSNRANIVLLPKEEHAHVLSAFRPISILCYVPKLISKVLANRLAAFLPSLISVSQTGFVKGRLITENFNTARELISNITNGSHPSVLLKLDFHKAFDSVAWPFLFQVLHHRSFPARYVSWVNLLLTSSTSNILLNGKVGPSFQHKRGLRQGDPLSPFLFLLAADVLTKMIDSLATSLPHNIVPKILSPFFLLQYADDTLVFVTTKGKAIQSLMLSLKAFSSVSGLDLNWNKTTFVPFNLCQRDVARVERLLSCTHSSLPLIYLGLPLTARRPSRLCFQNLIDRIRKRLQEWQGGFLSKAGRTVLVSSVLSTIPVYFMSVFVLPAWVIKEIDRVRRDFIWKNSANGSKGIHLLSWDRMCMPKSIGGVGLVNLKLHNISLVLRWLWRLYAQPESQWSTLACTLYGKRRQHTQPLFWCQAGSFFWKDLMSLRNYFQLSVLFDINAGSNTPFWFAKWGESILAFFSSHPHPSMTRQNKHMMVKDAIDNPYVFLSAPFSNDMCTILDAVRDVTLSTGPDTIRWRWSSNGEYSTASMYRSLVAAGKTTFRFKNLWSLKVPPSLKHFLYFLSLRRILTQDQLLKRKILVTPHCSMCHQSIMEDAQHLFCDCTFAIDIWSRLQFSTSVTESIERVFCFLHDATVAGTRVRKTTMAAALWGMWKERNNRIFRNERRNSQALHDWIVQESTIFMKFC